MSSANDFPTLGESRASSRVPTSNCPANKTGSKTQGKKGKNRIKIPLDYTVISSGDHSSSSRNTATVAAAKANPSAAKSVSALMSEKTKALMSKPYASEKPRGKVTEFMDLDADCRYIIYDFVCQDERILELQWDGPIKEAHKKEHHATHYWYRPTAKARLPPSIIHVHGESRWYVLEKKQHYTLVNFASIDLRGDGRANPWVKNAPVELYYNPRADIPYFGVNMCMRPVVNFIQDMSLKGLSMSKIAMICSGKLTNECHDWLDEEEWLHGPDEYSIDLGHNIAGGITPMEALHGLHKDVSLTERTCGIPGLKEIFFVVPTHLTDISNAYMMEANQIKNNIGMREATSEGLADGQVTFTRRIRSDIERVMSGAGLRRCGGDLNKWVGDDMPTFRFVNFCPRPDIKQNKIHDAIVIDESTEGKVWKLTRWANGKAKDEIQDKYQCLIEVPEKEFNQQPYQEIGFWGTPDKVEFAKAAVIEHLVSYHPR